MTCAASALRVLCRQFAVHFTTVLVWILLFSVVMYDALVSVSEFRRLRSCRHIIIIIIIIIIIVSE